MQSAHPLGHGAVEATHLVDVGVSHISDCSQIPSRRAGDLSVGEFERIYDPSAGEDERWYVNDHTIVRDESGTWHLIGITHPEPASPFDELDLGHATAPDAPRPVDEAADRAVHRPDVGRDPSLGAAHRVPRHAVLDVLLRGRPREVRVPHPSRHLDRLHDLDATSREPDGGRRLRSARPDGAVGRRPVGHVLHRDERAERRRARRRRGRVRRPRALDRQAHRVPRRDDGHGRGADRVAVRVRAAMVDSTC